VIKKIADSESKSQSDSAPLPSAPLLHEIGDTDGGKKTRRKTNKKLKKIKKGRRRFIKTYRRYT
jgi:hypothetical protein